MRVLILPEWYPAESQTAAGSFVRDQARAVSRLHDVRVMTHDPRRLSGRSEPAVSESVEDGIRTLRIRTRFRRGTPAGRAEFTLLADRALRRLWRDGKPPDLIHAHVYASGLVALLLSRRRCPVVLSEHHSDFVEGLVDGRMSLAAHAVLKHARVVCPVSDALRDAMRRFEPLGHYEVVPNVVDSDPFVAARARLSSPPRSRRLLVVAFLNRQKGLEHLFKALAGLAETRRDFGVDIIGDGPCRPELEEFARGHLPPGLVTFHGVGKREAVAEAMALSHALVVPSVVETFGVVVIEAIAAGLPVVTTTAVPAREWIPPGAGMVVPPGDSQALADAIGVMMDRNQRPSHAAAALVAEHFSESVVAARWDEIYRRASASVHPTSTPRWTHLNLRPSAADHLPSRCEPAQGKH